MSDFALDATTTCGLIIDVQERFMSAIPSIAPDASTGRSLGVLASGLSLLGVPQVITEQVPDKLGATLPHLSAAADGARCLAKTTFSCMDDPAIRDCLGATHAETVIVAGIEARVRLINRSGFAHARLPRVRCR